MDGPEAVDLVVLLAIPPNEAGTTHMKLLTALTTRLADDELRARIQSATTPDELLSALDDKGTRNILPLFLCANYRLRNGLPGGYCSHLHGCGISGKAGRKLGVNIYVEKQGANGIEERLTAEQLNSATACILRRKSLSRRASVLTAFPRFLCLLPSRFAMQKR